MLGNKTAAQRAQAYDPATRKSIINLLDNESGSKDKSVLTTQKKKLRSESLGDVAQIFVPIDDPAIENYAWSGDHRLNRRE